MEAKIQELSMPVCFDYCGTEGDYLVILRLLFTSQYVCDVGFLRACEPSDGCADGYHIARICGKRITVAQHYDTKEAAAASLFELWKQ